jgi:hypothetical protein
MAKYLIAKGNTFNNIVTVTDTAGAAVDLTGATVSMAIIDRNGTQLTQVNVTTHTTPLSGITTISIAATTTDTFAFGCYECVISSTLSNAEVFELQYGMIEVTPKLIS